jgi:hypothetical protein
MKPDNFSKVPSSYTFVGKGDDRERLRRQLTAKKQRFAAWVREQLEAELFGRRRASAAHSIRIGECIRVLCGTNQYLEALLRETKRDDKETKLRREFVMEALLQDVKRQVGEAVFIIAGSTADVRSDASKPPSAATKRRKGDAP